jgi:hypothetical protein
MTLENPSQISEFVYESLPLTYPFGGSDFDRTRIAPGRVNKQCVVVLVFPAVDGADYSKYDSRVLGLPA